MGRLTRRQILSQKSSGRCRERSGAKRDGGSEWVQGVLWALPDSLLSHGDAGKRNTEPPAWRFSMEYRHSDVVRAPPTLEYAVTLRCCPLVSIGEPCAASVTEAALCVGLSANQGSREPLSWYADRHGRTLPVRCRCPQSWVGQSPQAMKRFT